MTNIAIRAENLSKHYKIGAKYRHNTLVDQLANMKSIFQFNAHRNDRIFWALKDVSFEVTQGEIVGIIGQNGAGKSTLLKVISQITLPTKGRAELYGRVGSLLEVGTGFHAELTGRENIYLNGAIIGMKKDEIRRRFDEIVEFSGIGQFLDVPVKRYSSGMYVRLGFSVAAHLDPEILLVDEVLSVGDAEFQKKCLDKIRGAAKGGKTVLFISHNMTAVNSLCKRVIWLRGGQIVEDGPSAEIVTQYLTNSKEAKDVTEEVWDDVAAAPGNDMVRLRRVCVRRPGGRLAAALTMRTPFQVEVEYWNLIPGSHLHIALHVYTADGIVAFTTGNIGEKDPMSAGLFRSTCNFPGDLLNSGVYRLVLLVVKDGSSVICTHESGVSIEVLDLQKRDGTYFGREPGVVQPVLQWTTEYLSEEQEMELYSRSAGAV